MFEWALCTIWLLSGLTHEPSTIMTIKPFDGSLLRVSESTSGSIGFYSESGSYLRVFAPGTWESVMCKPTRESDGEGES